MADKVKDKLDDLVDALSSDYNTRESLFGDAGLLQELKKRFVEKALSGELTEHLGYEKHAKCSGDNFRNGTSRKRLTDESGVLEVNIPRDRNGTFEPKLIQKHQTRFPEFDEKIIALYARGLSVSDIQAQLKELYRVDFSTSLISEVTASVLDDVKAWQNRPLDALYPIVYLDCIVVKVRQDKRILNKAVYLALGVNLEGKKELLGMWISQNEGAKFWLSVLTELKNRGLNDIFIACVDGLTGFPEAIEAVYPRTQVQLCIVHMIRNSMKYVSWKDRKSLAADLRLVYSAASAENAEIALSAFSEKWDKQYPSVSRSWLNHWERVTPFFSYPADIRKAIYTTNAIESLNMTLRKVIKNKRVFPNDDSVFKILYLAINNVSKKWTMPIHHWKQAMNWFSIEFSERLTKGEQ